MDTFDLGRDRAAQGSLTDTEERALLISRTYSHLAGAILAFTLIELLLFRLGLAEPIARATVGAGRFGWLLVLGGFVVVGWLARSTAHKARSAAAQYAALFGYVAAEALIFVPLLYVADAYAPGVIQSAALVTLLGFGALTAIALVTRKDFSFLRALLMWGGVAAILLVVGGAVFGATLGTWFSVGMVALAGASVLYDTSNLLLRYPADRHVAAALELFASIALMFWYVLRLMMNARR